MTANDPVLSSIGNVTSNSVGPIVGTLSDGSIPIPESVVSQPEGTGVDSTPSLPTWKGKDTVHVVEDQLLSGEMDTEKTRCNCDGIGVVESDSGSISIKGMVVADESANSNPASSSFPSSSLSDDDSDAISLFAIKPNLKALSFIGQEVGPYEVTRELGRGGMGVVYKARHKLLRREVALKMILRSGCDSEVISRFREEARSVATLKHPGIVQIHEYGEHQGVPWFSLEFVDGKTLAQLTAKDPLPPERAARIIADVAAAAAYAHERGILHRDIKPANVIVAAGDVAKLTDFGLAKQVTSDADESDHKTLEGQIIGTPGFMSPEQARGVVDQVGPHSDQYSLGATLYFLLTRRAPFVGTPMDVVLQAINDEPLTVRQLQPAIPLDLETICLKAMSKRT